MSDQIRSTHWLGPRLRELRQAMGLSLAQFQEKTGVPAVVMGSYERGDRRASVERADELLGIFGKRLEIVDSTDPNAVSIRTPQELIALLEGAATQIRLSLTELPDTE